MCIISLTWRRGLVAVAAFGSASARNADFRCEETAAWFPKASADHLDAAAIPALMRCLLDPRGTADQGRSAAVAGGAVHGKEVQRRAAGRWGGDNQVVLPAVSGLRLVQLA